MTRTVLAGDVGGTNTRLALVELDGTAPRVLREQWYPSRDFPGLAPIVRAFLGDAERPERAGFGIACPIVDDECVTPNLLWRVRARVLAGEIGVPRTAIVNDFHAIGYGLDTLADADMATLQPGVPDPHGVTALIGAGTGLGQAFVVRGDAAPRVLASEGGHANFAPRTAVEWGLHEYLAARYGHVSWERVLSGDGIVDVYHYLGRCGPHAAQPSVEAEMEHELAAAVISRHGLAGTDPLCAATLELFAAAYGSQAGNLALTVMATGGIYIAGGIAPRIVPLLAAGGFLAAFADKGRLSPMLQRVPVHVITNPNVGLFGAAVVAARL